MRFKFKDISFGKITERYGMLLFLLLIFLIGLFIGSLTVSGTSEDNKSFLTNTLKSFTVFNTNSSISSILLSSLMNNFIFFFCAFLTGLMVIGFPLSVMLIFYKGFSVGFTIGFICALYGFKGILISAVCILPQILITSITLILACGKAMQFSLSLFSLFSSGRRNKGEIPDILPYCFSVLILFLISLISVLFDAFISPFFLKLFIG